MKDEIEWNFLLFGLGALVAGLIFKLVFVYVIGIWLIGFAAIGIIIYIACLPLIIRCMVSLLDLFAIVAQHFGFVKKSPKKENNSK